MKKCSLIGFTAFLLVLAACNRLRPERSYEVVGDSTAIVQKAFNADSGKVRVLMLVSPTCGVCLRGASDVTEDILKRKGGKNISLYVVWVPRLHALEKNVSPATGVVATSWAKQYWDGQDLLGEQYREVLDWNDFAWDVYMLYGPHELRSNHAKLLIADHFARKCYRTARSKFWVSNSQWFYFS
jgi:hypothetical protein